MGEEVLGSFVIETMPILTTNIPYRLFMTPDRFVAVKFESVEEALLVTVDGNVREDLPEQTIKLRQGQETPGVTERDGKLQILSQTVLDANTDNFELTYSHIINIKMKKGGFSRLQWTKVGRMLISTYQNKHKFKISNGQIFEDCLIAVHSALPDDLKNQIILRATRYCPVCHDEFQDWVEVCPDCRAELVKELPSQSPLIKSGKTEEPLVHISTAPNELIANMWSEILEENGIYCLVKRGHLAATHTPLAMSCEIHVLASQVGNAQEILTSLTNNQHEVS